MANQKEVSDAAYKLGRLLNGGVIGYYAGGKTSEAMSRVIPQKLLAAVEKHKKIQLGTSLAQSFIPGAGVAAMAVAVGSIWKMYYDINQVLGISISENAGKSLTSAILTNLAAFGGHSVATVLSEGAKFIPLVGWMASAAVTTASTTAIVYGSAYLYLTALTEMYQSAGKFDLDYLNSVVGSNASKTNSLYSSSANEDDVTRKVKQIISEKLGVDYYRITEKASLSNDLDVDSFDAVEIVMELEKEFGITIPDDDASSITTVGDAIKVVRRTLKR